MERLNAIRKSPMHRLFLRVASFLLTLSLALPLPAQPVAAKDMVFFRQDWCPISRDRDLLRTQFRLTMSGCCVFKAEYVGLDLVEAAVVIARLQEHVVLVQDLSVCTGDNEELKRERKAAADAEEAVRRNEATEERRAIAGKLRAVELPLLCMRAGELLRNQFSLPEASAMGKEATPFVLEELRRRGTGVDKARVQQQLVRTGDTECHLFAAWGLPMSSNHTTTSNRSSVQHVYGLTTYAYTERGRVTALQGTR
jgi:hypothetical protein